MTVERDDDALVLRVSGETHVLDDATARDLRAALDDALHRVDEFTHTVSEHRPDGSYVVGRRRADSAGQRKVFDSFDDVRACFAALPAEFTADDVTCASGSRRHALVRHFAEHPGFDCDLVSRQPLTARKGGTVE